MPFGKLPYSGVVFFKTSAAAVITSARAFWGPLTSGYAGVEISSAQVVNTVIFICPGFTQRRLATKIVQQGHYIWIDGTEYYLITGLKDFGSHTEFTGLRQSTSQAFVATTAAGIVSEWPFASLATLTTDGQGRNTLTNTNSVAYDSSKPSQIPYAVGSALFVSASSKRLSITDASQVQLDLTGVMTLAFRVKLVTVPSGATVFGFMAKASTAPNLGYYVYMDSSAVISFETSSDGTAFNTAVAGSAFSAGQWYSVCVVYDGVDARIYVNGALDTASLNPNPYTTGVYNNGQIFALGCRSDASQFLNGYMAHPYVFNQNKSAAQVLAWHNTDLWT